MNNHQLIRHGYPRASLAYREWRCVGDARLLCTGLVSVSFHTALLLSFLSATLVELWYRPPGAGRGRRAAALIGQARRRAARN